VTPSDSESDEMQAIMDKSLLSPLTADPSLNDWSCWQVLELYEWAEPTSQSMLIAGGCGAKGVRQRLVNLHQGGSRRVRHETAHEKTWRAAKLERVPFDSDT
jgi:hypothetical protein